MSRVMVNVPRPRYARYDCPFRRLYVASPPLYTSTPLSSRAPSPKREPSAAKEAAALAVCAWGSMGNYGQGRNSKEVSRSSSGQE